VYFVEAAWPAWDLGGSGGNPVGIRGTEIVLDLNDLMWFTAPFLNLRTGNKNDEDYACDSPGAAAA